MPKYTYTARRENGDEYTGEVDAPEKYAVFAHIKREKGTLLSFSEKKGLRAMSMKGVLGSFGGVKMRDRIIFARNLATMLEAGLSASRALSVLERQTKNLRFKTIIADVAAQLQSGFPLSDAMEKYPRVFSTLFVAMVRSGEETGGLSEALNVIGVQLEQSYTLRKKIRGAMMYPGIIVSAMVLIGILMLIYVVPTLSSTFSQLGVELPRSTQIVIGTSDFLRTNSLLALGGALTIAAGLIALARSSRGAYALESLLLYVPIVGGLIRETNAARLSRTLSSLLSAGVDVVQSLEITHEVVQNKHFKATLVTAQANVQKGLPMSEVFKGAEHLYPPLVAEMVAVGEETGQISPMLLRVATFYEEEVSQKTKDMSTIIEPFLMVFIGAAVGFFALSMISPIYSLSTAI